MPGSRHVAPRLRTRDLDLRLRHTFRIARGASDSRENLLVELEADGCTGQGEAAPIRRYDESRQSAREAVVRMAAAGLGDGRAYSQAVARVAVAGQRAAQAALDMALHDLAARRLEVPVHELLGLDGRTAPPTSFTIGLDTPEIVATKVREAAGFAVLKVKLGGADDRAVLEAVRDCTRQPLRVDANEGWTLDGALERLEWLARLGVEFVEQPLPAHQLEDTRALRRRSPLPFVADESVHTAADIPGLVGAFDGINIKLMKCGGLGEALRMIAVARAHGLKVMLGCMIESSLGIAAAAQLLALVDYADLDGHLLVANDPFEGLRFESGCVLPSDQPGLGVITRRPK